MTGQNKIRQYININVTSGYCACCLKELIGDSMDKDIEDMIRDAEGNYFCCKECRAEFWRQNRLEMDSALGEWLRGY